MEKIKAMLVMSVAILVFGMSLTAVNAGSMYDRVIQGQGFMEYGGQVEVVGIQLVSPSELHASLYPTSSAIAGHNYEAELFVSGDLLEIQIANFTQAQITNGQTDLVIFTNLSISNFGTLDVEIK